MRAGHAPAVQAKPQPGVPAPSASPASVQQHLGEGETMAPEVTSRFSRAYGHDLSDVRLHRDSPAASALGARAVTVGRDVAFAPGEYKPGTPAGDMLIGHELAHVVQQAAGAGRLQGAGLGEDGYEREADRAASDALAGLRVQRLSVLGTPAVQRTPASMPGPTQCEVPKDGAAPQCVAPGQPAPADAAPPPAEQTIYFEGVALAPDPQHLRRELERIVVEGGEAGASAFASRFVNMEPLRRISLEAQHGPELVAAIQTALGEAITLLEEDDKEYLLFFEEAAKAAIWEILANSREQIEAELEHYGGRDGAGIDNDGASGAGPTGGPDRAAIGGLQRAARMLADRRAATDSAARASIASRGAVDRAARDNPFLVPRGLTDAADQDRKAWLEEEKAYKHLADQLRAEFPVLAAYASAPDAAARLGALASLPPHQAASEVSQEAHQRLANISTVEKELGGRFNVWTQPAVVRITLQQQNATPAQRRIVGDHAAHVTADAESSKMLYAALAVGLGLLAAIPTGGSSLLAGVAAAATIVGAGLTIYTTYESIQTYALESAASGTDFDKARAIAQNDPSLMWLALDVVATIGDIYGAARAFKALKEAISVFKASRAAELVAAARSAGLSVEGQARMLARVLQETGEGTKGIPQTLESIAGAFRRVAETHADDALAQGFHKAAEQMMKEKRMIVLPFGATGAEKTRLIREALAARGITSKTAVNQALIEYAGQFKEGAKGIFDPVRRIVVVQGEGALADVASAIAHEIAHDTQLGNKLKSVLDFRGEYQAFVAQREFLLRLPADVLPAEYRWLRAPDYEAQIVKRLTKKYNLKAPPGFGTGARDIADDMANQILGLLKG